MPRPRKDGSPARAKNRRALTELLVRRLRPEDTPFNVWDTDEPGLVLRVHPSSKRAFKLVYRSHGRPRWYHIGLVALSDARRKARKIKAAVDEGKDPAAEKRAERGADTFAELADRYLSEHAKRVNKSWRQGRGLVERYLLPRWGKLNAKAISRADVRGLAAKIEAPVLANQVLAAASAIFSWGVKQDVISVNRSSASSATPRRAESASCPTPRSPGSGPPPPPPACCAALP